MTVGTFTPLQQGTPDAAWAHRLAAAPRLPELGRGDALVVVAAHPDDETLGAGGLIAAAARNGATVRVVVATAGEASHPSSPTHPPDQLAAIRRREVQAAVGTLVTGLEPVLLGLADGTLHTRGDQLAALLEPHLRDATHVVTPWDGDRHPDHEAVARAVTSLVSARPTIVHWQYPIWAWHWGRPDGDDLPWSRIGSLPLDTRTHEVKRAAIAAHRSQHAPLSNAVGDEAILPPPVLAHFERPVEAFVVATPRAADASYFEALYDNATDPWGLAERFYERRKRELLLATLPRDRFHRVFEPGCATGELSVRLAERCDELVSWDVAAAAVARTRARCPDSVQVEQATIPAQWPAGRFDLVVLSEVGYYCSDLDLLVHRVRTGLATDGTVVACHWRRPAPDHPHTAEAVHAALRAGLPELATIARHEEDDFLLDVLSADHRSVAARDGVLG